MLATSNVAVQFGAKPLFEQVTVKFADGNRYGLIGANGSGKSTLMKVLGGDLDATAGDVMLQQGLRLGKLNQNQFGYEDDRVLDVVMRGHTELWAAMTERDRIYADPNATDEDYMKAAELEGVFAEYGGYDAEARAGAILTDAGIHESRHNGPMREVPPGLKLRVLLAQALFSRPDVLLLDEPTNNLDIHSIGWLERAINNYDATMVIISHDRHFLNQVCTHIADLDFQQLKVYPGNYDDFMLASVQARARVEASNAKAKDRISDLQEFVRRFSANASKARQATSRKKQLEKIKIEEIRPSSRQNPYIRFEQGKKLYRNALSVEKLDFTYPDSEEQVLKDVNFNIEAGERVAVIGPNGAGKTTLMRCLAGELKPTSGKITWVENAQPGYMPQDPQAEFEEKTDLFAWMSRYTGKADDDQIVRATLGRLLFTGDETKKSVKVLSGGEKGRMIYGKLILTKPNVLLMDEPTNHMDMETIESLQIGLEQYPGTLIFVSHDREFVGGLATRIIELKGGTITDFRGTYDEYLKAQGLGRLSDVAPERGKLLGHRPFAFFFLSRSLSEFAYQMATVAVGWQIYALTDSAFALGLAGLVQFLPTALLVFVAGHVADRYDRRRVVQACQIVECATAAFLAWGSAAGWLDVKEIFIALGVLGTAGAFESPASSALLPAVVPDGLLQQGTAFSTGAWQLASILAPAAGGLLYAVSPGLPYGVMAVLSLSALCATGLIRVDRPPPDDAPPTWSGVFAGVRFIRGNRAILGTISLDLFAVLLGGATALLPVYARDILHTGAWGLGVLRAVPAAGALLMSVLLARHALSRRAGMRLFQSVIVFGLATVVFAVSRSFWLSVIALAVMGAADTVSVVIRTSLVQLRTPDHMRGRVGAVNFLFINASNQLGEFESGMTAALLGAVPAVALGGVGTIVVALLWMKLFPELRRVEKL